MDQRHGDQPMEMSVIGSGRPSCQEAPNGGDTADAARMHQEAMVMLADHRHVGGRWVSLRICINFFSAACVSFSAWDAEAMSLSLAISCGHMLRA